MFYLRFFGLMIAYFACCGAAVVCAIMTIFRVIGNDWLWAASSFMLAIGLMMLGVAALSAFFRTNLYG